MTLYYLLRNLLHQIMHNQSTAPNMDYVDLCGMFPSGFGQSSVFLVCSSTNSLPTTSTFGASVNVDEVRSVSH